ncbi:MAG: protein kinase, partial [Myxococcales bacterium]|nr:protein kinase [Myxococcales bacterium]
MTLLPEALGPFSIVSVLGEGGSGIVYHARITGRDVALKVLRKELALTEREVARFVAEAERAQRVSHPSLVHVEGVGCLDDGRPYLVMPLLRGEGLAAVLARGR